MIQGYPSPQWLGAGSTHYVIPAKEHVKELELSWIRAVRPSRQPLRRFLRMRNFLNAIKAFPHAEERPEGASRSTHDRSAVNSFTTSKAGIYFRNGYRLLLV